MRILSIVVWSIKLNREKLVGSQLFEFRRNICAASPTVQNHGYTNSFMIMPAAMVSIYSRHKRRTEGRSLRVRNVQFKRHFIDAFSIFTAITTHIHFYTFCFLQIVRVSSAFREHFYAVDAIYNYFL